MSGRRIDDHSFWAGGRSKGSVFPEGAKIKDAMSSAEGVGGLSHYEDTTEAIKSQQELSKKKALSHPARPGYRV